MPMMKETMLKRLLLQIAAAGGGGSAPVQDTATGNPLVFFTDMARPLKSLLIPFTPIQSGTGDPSPSNIRSILPWNGLNVGQINGIVPDISNNSGMEKVNGQWQNSATDTKTRFDAYIQLFKGGTYIKGAGSKAIASSGIYSITFNVDDANCNRIVFLHSGSGYNLSVKFPFELPQGTYTISFNVVSANPSVVGGLAIKDIFLVAGGDVQRTETDIVFPSPVYGGTLDVVSGVMTVEYAVSILNGQEAWARYSTSGDNNYRFRTDALSNRLVGDNVNGTQKCDCLTPTTGKATSGNSTIITGTRNSITFMASSERLYVYVPDLISDSESLDEWKAYISEHPITVVYELATPQEIQLTPAQLTAIIGDNTIWSNADGSMTAVYLKKE